MNFQAEITCEDPGNNIYKFDGFIKVPKSLFDGGVSGYSTINNLTSNITFPLTSDNLLLRGTTLKNAEWIYGAVVYTGHSTKIMMNTSNARVKMSRNERMLNRQIIYIFIMQLILCVFASIYGTLWERANREKSYEYLHIAFVHKKVWMNYLVWTLVRFGSWILMFTYFIPISLVVTVEIVRVCQALFMTWDIDMYD